MSLVFVRIVSKVSISYLDISFVDNVATNFFDSLRFRVESKFPNSLRCIFKLLGIMLLCNFEI